MTCNKAPPKVTNTQHDFEDFATLLWKSKFVQENTLEECMTDSAFRAKNWNGSVINTSSTEEHIKDLISAGIIKKIALEAQ